MLNLFSLRTNYWKNGTQFMGKWTARIMGTHKIVQLTFLYR
jgi:hypothetical protein